MISSKLHSFAVFPPAGVIKGLQYRRLSASIMKVFLLFVISCLVTGCKGGSEFSHSPDDQINADLYSESEGSNEDEDEASVPSILSLTVEDFSVGNNGITIPGVPAWFTLKKKKNIAICITSISGSTDCFPDENLDRSLCPKTERCTYDDVATGSETFVVTVFNINNLGKGMVKRALKFQCENLGDFRVNKCDDMRSYIEDTNKRRALWEGSFILSARDLTTDEKKTLESYSRLDTLTRIFPGSENAETGALSAPFEVCIGDQYVGWDCDPLREISVRAEFKE